MFRFGVQLRCGQDIVQVQKSIPNEGVSLYSGDGLDSFMEELRINLILSAKSVEFREVG